MKEFLIKAEVKWEFDEASRRRGYRPNPMMDEPREEELEDLSLEELSFLEGMGREKPPVKTRYGGRSEEYDPTAREWVEDDFEDDGEEAKGTE